MPEITPSKYLVQAGWDDVPHLSAEQKEKMLRETQPYLRAARSKGTPALGSGAIYPMAKEDYEVKPFAIPAHYKRCYGMDVGWNRTAVIWLAQDPSDSTVYAYTEHYRGKAQPPIHATAIKARGEWIPGFVDPSARGRSVDEGKQLLAQYRSLGLKLQPAINSVDVGVDLIWMWLEIGRLKIFSTCQNLLAEMAIYRRDENGKIVKTFDHACDALRYGCISGIPLATPVPAPARHGVTGNVVDPVAGY